MSWKAECVTGDGNKSGATAVDWATAFDWLRVMASLSAAPRSAAHHLDAARAGDSFIIYVGHEAYQMTEV